MPLLSPTQRQRYEERQSVDFGYASPASPASAATSSSSAVARRVFRRVPFDIKDYEELNIPDVVATFADLPAGSCW